MPTNIPWPTILMVVALVGMFYFLMIRPQQKRMKEQQEMQSAITPGTRVMLTSGIFATVQHVGDQQMVVELAPDVEVTVVKGAIARVVPADEDEFEYEDEPCALPEPTATPAVEPAVVAADVTPSPVVQGTEKKGE